MNHWSDELLALKTVYGSTVQACNEAVKWCRTQPDLSAAWQNCHRPDWLLWLLQWRAPDTLDSKIAFVRIACEIARMTLHAVPMGEDRPCLAIEAAERWADNPIGENAAYAARAARAARAAYAARAARAADVARAADAAAYAADAAAYAARAARAADVARAADAAAYAADAARAADAADVARAAACNIIRKYFPEAPKIEGL